MKRSLFLRHHTFKNKITDPLQISESFYFRKLVTNSLRPSSALRFEKVRVQNFSMVLIKQQRQQKTARLKLILNKAKSKLKLSKWERFKKVICTRLNTFTQRRCNGMYRVQQFKYILTSVSS